MIPESIIEVHANSDLKRRVELAAAKHDLPVAEYCLRAIEQQLLEDEFVNPDIESAPAHRNDLEFLEDLRKLRQKILDERGGELIDVDAILDEIRAERMHELTGLH